MSELLFASGKINKMEIKNKLIMLALHTGFSDEGKISERDMEFYKARAIGGAGAITCLGKISSGGGMKIMHSIASDEYMEGYKKLSDMVHEYDCKLIVQLFHCGRNADTEMLGGIKPVAPSPISSVIYRERPSEMTAEQIKETIADFGRAALRCKEAGVDAVEISCSAGYLLTQFLSPTTNLREDEYGGNEEKRMKAPLEAIRAVRKAVGNDYPVILRISGAQMMPDGYDAAFMQRFCALADSENLIDAVNVTGGWHEAPIPQITFHVPRGGFAFLADEIKRVVNIPVIACNRINDKGTAEKILEDGLADFIGTARGFLADPQFGNRLHAGKTYNICQGCNKCIETVLHGGTVKCAYNPEAGQEYLDVKHRKIATAKKVLVIGGGPAGLMAAKKAAQRGYKVTLCTDESKLGGQLNLAAVPPLKQDIFLFIDNIENELKELGVNILFNTKVDADFALKFEPYFVVIASGSKPTIPNIPGINRENVCLAIDVLKGDKALIERVKRGSTVIIGGGSLGLEAAEYIAHKCFSTDKSFDFMREYISENIPSIYSPVNITLIEMTKRIASELGGTRWIALKALKENNVNTITETKVISINDGYVTVEGKKGIMDISADNVILAMGSESYDSGIAEALQNEKISYAVLGDAREVGDAMNALQDAYELFLRVYIA